MGIYLSAPSFQLPVPSSQFPANRQRPVAQIRILPVVDLKVYPSDTPIAGLVLAHGAGGGQLTGFMVEAARGLASRQVTTATFDFPYITAGRKVPDRAPVLEQAWREAIEAARSRMRDLPLFIGGKSMGGRIASQVAAQGSAVPLSGLIFFGYPLHPPGRPEQMRDAHLPDIREPMLFIQGGKDAFGGSEEIRALLPRLQRATMHEIEGGDHSFRVPGGKPGQQQAIVEVLDTAAAWIRSMSA
jgi:uncharacterized protein